VGARELPLRWGVVGLGSAGRSKIKALKDLSALGIHAQLVAAVTRRPHALETLPPEVQRELRLEGVALEGSLEALLARSDIDAVAICTESALHEAQAEHVLRSGRHCLVDFPLASTHAGLERLYALADERGLLLHQELIGALTPQHLALRELCEARPSDDPLASLTVRFQGGLYRWVAEECEAGRAPLLALARLQRAWDLLGPLTPSSAALHTLTSGRERVGVRLELTAHNAEGALLTLSEERKVGGGRATSVEALTRSGHPLTPTARPARASLFVQDIESFYEQWAQLREGRSPTPYVSREAQGALLGFIERVSEMISVSPSP
jgi:hypothetical protein